MLSQSHRLLEHCFRTHMETAVATDGIACLPTEFRKSKAGLPKASSMLLPASAGSLVACLLLGSLRGHLVGTRVWETFSTQRCPPGSKSEPGLGSCSEWTWGGDLGAPGQHLPGLAGALVRGVESCWPRPPCVLPAQVVLEASGSALLPAAVATQLWALHLPPAPQAPTSTPPPAFCLALGSPCQGPGQSPCPPFFSLPQEVAPSSRPPASP